MARYQTRGIILLVLASTALSIYILFNGYPPPRVIAISMSLSLNLFFIVLSSWVVFRKSSSKKIISRSVAVILFYIFCLIVQFAVAYKTTGLKIDENYTASPSALDCLYFSVITWTTVGYGDIVPTGQAKIFAATEALSAYFAMAFLISGIVKLWEDDD